MPNSEGNLIDQEIKWGMWLAKYKPIFKAGLIVALVALSLGLWTYSLYGFLDYALFSSASEKNLELAVARDPINWPSIKATNEPAQLVWNAPQVLSTRTGTDLLVEIENQNPKWLANFTYTLSAGDKTQNGKDFVLPGTKKYLIASFKEERSGVNFSITDVRWQKIDAREIGGDYQKFFANRMNFVFGETKYVPPSADLPGRVSFSVWDKSAYSFWEAKFLVLIRRGSDIAGANSVVLEKLKSGEKREVEINWPERLGGFSSIEIVPDINILDKEKFMPPGV